jgi:hypothetical protein
MSNQQYQNRAASAGTRIVLQRRQIGGAMRVKEFLDSRRFREMAPSGRLCGDVSSGPSESWIAPDGSYLYQMHGNASKLVGYATRPDGSHEEIT